MVETQFKIDRKVKGLGEKFRGGAEIFKSLI